MMVSSSSSSSSSSPSTARGNDGNDETDQLPVDPSLNSDLNITPSHLSNVQAPSGGAGTVANNYNYIRPPESSCSNATNTAPASPSTPASLLLHDRTPPAAFSPPPTDPNSPQSPAVGSDGGDSSGSREGYVCQYPGCKNKTVYRRRCQLRKHEKQHTKPNKCDICGNYRAAEKKDLHRHQRTKHADEVRDRPEVWREMTKCPTCKYRARHDNVKRHRQLLKH